MEEQIVENYETRALGFPVIIQQVKLRRFRDDWVAEIDWDALMLVALFALAHKPAPLSGNEVRFIRTYMKKTLKEFASLCEVKSHQAVMNWESKEDDYTGMNRATEILLRTRIIGLTLPLIREPSEIEYQDPATIVTQTLDEVSQFKKGPPKPLSLFSKEPDSGQLNYAYG